MRVLLSFVVFVSLGLNPVPGMAKTKKQTDFEKFSVDFLSLYEKAKSDRKYFKEMFPKKADQKFVFDLLKKEKVGALAEVFAGSNKFIIKSPGQSATLVFLDNGFGKFSLNGKTISIKEGDSAEKNYQVIKKILERKKHGQNFIDMLIPEAEAFVVIAVIGVAALGLLGLWWWSRRNKKPEPRADKLVEKLQDEGVSKAYLNCKVDHKKQITSVVDQAISNKSNIGQAALLEFTDRASTDHWRMSIKFADPQKQDCDEMEVTMSHKKYGKGEYIVSGKKPIGFDPREVALMSCICCKTLPHKNKKCDQLHNAHSSIHWPDKNPGGGGGGAAGSSGR